MEGGESRMMRAGYLPLVMAFVVAPVLQAGAQNLPWPGNAPTAAPRSQAAMTPAPMSPAPMTAPTPMMGSPMMGAPMGGALGGMGGGGGRRRKPAALRGRIRQDARRRAEEGRWPPSRRAKSTSAREELCKLDHRLMARPSRNGSSSPSRAFPPAAFRPRSSTSSSRCMRRTEQAREKICAAGPGQRRHGRPRA